MRHELINKERLIQILNDIQHFFLEHGSETGQEDEAVVRELSAQAKKRLRKKVAHLHPADVAHILESIPTEERLAVWQQLPKEQQAPILIKLSAPVRESLIQILPTEDVINAAEILAGDEIADLAYLAQDLPDSVVERILECLPADQRSKIEEVLSYSSSSVGALMDFSVFTVPADSTVKSVLNQSRKLGRLPEHTQHVYVVDNRRTLLGTVPLQQLITLPMETPMKEVMTHSMVEFLPEDSAEQASFAFDRYQLTAAPVVDNNNVLIGRVCVDEIVNHMRVESEQHMLRQIGFSSSEDRFSDIWSGAKNRWLWLAVNLLSAFIATRVIALFEDKILELVVLATLMPVVASTAGNIGNQACTLIIRAIALGQMTHNSIRHFFIRELGISLLNGLVWGTIMGLFVGYMYSPGVGGVMGLSILLNFMLTCAIAITIPVVRDKLDLDPAIGAHVLVTFFADSFGFFIFLGMATLFL